MSKLRLFTKLIILFQLVILLSLGILGWQMISISKAALEKNIYQHLNSLANNLAEEATQYLANLNLRFAFILTLKNLSSLAEESKYLTRILESNRDFANFSLINIANKKIEIQIGEPAFLNLDNQLFPQAVSLDKVKLGDVYFLNGVPCIDVIYPLREKRILFTIVKLEKLLRKIEINFDRTGKTYLIDNQNKIITAKKDINSIAEFPENLREELKKNSGNVNFFWRGKNWISVFQRAKSLNWTIFLLQEEREAFAAVERMSSNALVWLLICVSGAGLIAFFVAKNLSKPIGRLSHYAEILGKGDLNKKIDLETNTYEISLLADSFNKMAEDLKKAQQMLVEREKYKQQLEIARSIQDSFLVKTYPQIQGLQMHAFYRAAEEVGGDYYDFFWLNDHCLGLVIGDVSGKGVPASLLMMAVRAVLRSIVSPLATASEILKQTNAILFKDIKRGVFVSMFLGIIDIAEKRLNYASAGHNPLLLIRDNEALWFKKNGLAIGIDSGKIFNEEVKDFYLDLKTGDTFLAYTDGIIEARNKFDEEFGEKHMEQIALRSAYSCQGLIIAINEGLKEFVGENKQFDDITMVAFKIE